MLQTRVSPERRHTLCASLRSRNALQHFTRATLDGNFQENCRGPGGAPWSSTGLCYYRKNPSASVWTHCLGKYLHTQFHSPQSASKQKHVAFSLTWTPIPNIWYANPCCWSFLHHPEFLFAQVIIPSTLWAPPWKLSCPGGPGTSPMRRIECWANVVLTRRIECWANVVQEGWNVIG